MIRILHRLAFFCTGLGLSREPLRDTRLHGTWRSDKAATTDYIRTHSDLTPAQIEKLAVVFGKLEVTFDERFMHSRMDDWEDRSRYYVLQIGSSFCVICTFSSTLGKKQILRYDFDDGSFWETSQIRKRGLEKERFVRVDDSQREANH